MLEKCKESQPIIKGIVESTTDDEGMLFEALYLNDELQQIITKYELLEAAQKSGEEQLENSDHVKCEDVEAIQTPGAELAENSDAQKVGGELPEKSHPSEAKSPAQVGTHSHSNLMDLPKVDGAESSC